MARFSLGSARLLSIVTNNCVIALRFSQKYVFFCIITNFTTCFLKRRDISRYKTRQVAARDVGRLPACMGRGRMGLLVGDLVVAGVEAGYHLVGDVEGGVEIEARAAQYDGVVALLGVVYLDE